MSKTVGGFSFIAVTAAQSMIAEYNLRNNDYEQIEDGKQEYFSVLNYLTVHLVINVLPQEIEDAGSFRQTICRSLHKTYGDEELSALMILAINNYHLREKNV